VGTSWYRCTAIDGATGWVTLALEAGDDNPADLEIVNWIENVDWQETGEDHWENDPDICSLPPSGAVLLFNDESLYENHGGFIIDQTNGITGLLAAPGWFQVHLATPIGSAGLTNQPGKSGTIRCSIRFYPPYSEENWNHTRDDYPLMVVKKKTTITPTQAVHTLESNAKIAYPRAGWFKAVATLISPGGATLTAVVTNVLRPSWSEIELEYWVESTNDEAIKGGSDRCANCIRDHTGSIGTDDGTGNQFYCASRNLIVAAINAKFSGACHLFNNCPQYAHDNASDPYDQNMMKNLAHGNPWRLWQYVVGAAFYLADRMQHPSIAHLVGPDLDTPSGYHRDVQQGYLGGAWVSAREIGTPAQLVFFEGLEWEKANDRGLLKWLDPATWPNFGPAASPADRRLDLTDAIVADNNQVHESQFNDGGVSIHPYSANRYGAIGRSQRMDADNLWDAWFPVISDVAGEQTYHGNTLELGYWKDDETEQVAWDVDTVFYGKLTIGRSARYQRDQADRYGGLIMTARVKKVVAAGGGKYKFWFYHKETWAVSYTGIAPTVETFTKWMQGGLIAAKPSPFRINSYSSSDNLVGPRRTDRAHVGHCIKFPSTQGFAGQIADHKAMIYQVHPFDSGDTDTIIPSERVERLAQPVPGVVTMAYDDAGEAFVSLVVDRDLATLGDQAKRLTQIDARGPKTYGAAFDEYSYKEISYDDSTKGVRIYFSHLQNTQNPFHEKVTITLTTDDNTYVQTVDLRLDATFGWQNTQIITFTFSETIQSVSYVKTNKPFSEDWESLAPLGAAPASWSQNSETYYFASFTGAVLTLYISPYWADDTVEVEVVFAAYGGSDSAYHAALVAGPHGASLWDDHWPVCQNCDAVMVRDENNMRAEQY
jgi:hypothetical protein